RVLGGGSDPGEEMSGDPRRARLRPSRCAGSAGASPSRYIRTGRFCRRLCRATINPMTLEREEYVEQVYFFRALRERMAEGQATQAVLERVHQEILSTTRLPFAIE